MHTLKHRDRPIPLFNPKSLGERTRSEFARFTRRHYGEEITQENFIKKILTNVAQMRSYLSNPDYGTIEHRIDKSQDYALEAIKLIEKLKSVSGTFQINKFKINKKLLDALKNEVRALDKQSLYLHSGFKKPGIPNAKKALEKFMHPELHPEQTALNYINSALDDVKNETNRLNYEIKNYFRNLPKDNTTTGRVKRFWDGVIKESWRWRITSEEPVKELQLLKDNEQFLRLVEWEYEALRDQIKLSSSG